MQDSPVKILFYSPNNPYGCFSNFANYPIRINGKNWPSSEHFYQAQKFVGTEFEEIIRSICKASEVFKFARSADLPLRKDWEEVKLDLMMLAVKSKFEQYEILKGILISTGNSLIIEHTENDRFWADGGDGSGKNMLGNILMRVRSNFRNRQENFIKPPWIVFPKTVFYHNQPVRNCEIYYLKKFTLWYKIINLEARAEYIRYFNIPENWRIYLENSMNLT